MSKNRFVGLISVLVIVAILAIAAFTGLERVKPGYVGIKQNKFGGEITVTERIGWTFVNPFTQKFTEYPVSTEFLILTKASTEGSEGDDSIDIPTKEGQNASVDCSVAFRIDNDKVKDLFVKYRGRDINYIEQTVIRNTLNGALMSISGTYSILEVNEKRDEITRLVKERMNKELNANGIIIEQFNLRALRLPESIQASFNAKIEAENQIRQAESKLKQAEIDAKTVLTKAEGEAKANAVLSASLTPTLVQLKNIEKLNPNVEVIYVPTDTNLFVNKAAQ